MATVELCERSAVSSAVTDNIIDISEYDYKREELLESWLTRQMLRTYGDNDDSTVKNPMIRLSVKFDALSDMSKHELLGYAKRTILGGGELELRDMFWNVLQRGGRADNSWNIIEKYADSLLINEKVYRKEH